MKKEERFSAKELFYLLPILFGLFMVLVIAFPLILGVLFLFQTGIPPEVVFIMSALIAFALDVAALRQWRRKPQSRRHRGAWLCFILAVPLIGALVFLLKKKNRTLHVIWDDEGPEP